MRTFLSMSFVLGFTIAAGAQAPPSGTPPAGAASSQTTVAAGEHAPDNAPVTVTGCLRAGEEQSTFVLAVLDPSGGDTARNDTTTGAQSPAPTGTTGTASQSSSLPKTLTYQLVPGASNTDLRSHVGQRVQVTGTVQASSGSTVQSKTATAGAAPNDTQPGDAQTPVVATTEQTRVKVQKLKVQSLKAVGGSCQ